MCSCCVQGPNAHRRREEENQLFENRDQKLAQILTDLDRCVHGRHKKDNCFSCGDNLGNLFLEPGQRIGTTLYGDAIVVPDNDKYDPKSWIRKNNPVKE